MIWNVPSPHTTSFAGRVRRLGPRDDRASAVVDNVPGRGQTPGHCRRQEVDFEFDRRTTLPRYPREDRQAHRRVDQARQNSAMCCAVCLKVSLVDIDRERAAVVIGAQHLHPDEPIEARSVPGGEQVGSVRRQRWALP